MRIIWAPSPGCGRSFAVPVYCTPFAAALLANKLKEAGLDEGVPVRIKPLGARFTVGSFDLEFVARHPFDPRARRAPHRDEAGHGGSFRRLEDRPHPDDPAIDFDEKRLRAIGEEGVDALVCDSTNVLREGFSPSESDVAATLWRHRRRSQGPCRRHHLRLACGAHRFRGAAPRARRAAKSCSPGRAMRNTIEAARATRLFARCRRLS